MDLQDFARRYTVAWCSQDPASVAAFFEPDGLLTVNDRPPAIGRAAIAQVAQSFMRDFPDLQVMLDRLIEEPEGAQYHWTLTGTHALTGRAVRVSGYEQWTLSPAGWIANSCGIFDSAEYARQVGKALK